MRITMFATSLTVVALAVISQCTASAQGDSEDEATGPTPYDPVVSIVLGVSGSKVSGHEAKLRLYATHAQGLYLRELSLRPTQIARDGVLSLSLRGFGSDDTRAQFMCSSLTDRTTLRYSAAQWRFLENTPLTVPSSSRRSEELTFEHRVAPEASVIWSYAVQNMNRFPGAPAEPERWRSRAWSISAGGNVGQGQLRLTLSDSRYFDRMLTDPNLSAQTWHMEALWAPGPALDISGTVSGTYLEQSSRSAGRLNDVALEGSASVGSIGEFTLRWDLHHARWADMGGPYVRDRRGVEAGLASRLGSMGLRLRWSYREVERVRGDHSYLDVPKWTAFSGRLSGKVLRHVRLTLRGSTERMWQRPQMATTDTRFSGFDGKDAFGTRLEGPVGQGSAYLSWSFLRRGNTARGTNVTNSTAATGLTWPVAAGLELFGEVAREVWRGRSEVTSFPTLSNYMPDSRLTSLGLVWAVDPNTWIWAGYTDIATDNDNPLLLEDGNYRSRYLTMSLRRKFVNGTEISLTLAPWSYRDRVIQTMNMSATTVALSASGRF